MSEYVGKITELPEALGNFMPNSSKKVVFGPTHFWPDYVLRCFDLEPSAGSHEPHTHEWLFLKATEVSTSTEKSIQLKEEHGVIFPAEFPTTSIMLLTKSILYSFASFLPKEM